jgi:DNA-binding transcriptional ArsR family regulator
METPWNLVLRMPAEARGWRVTVLVYDSCSEELLATDEGNLMSLLGQQKMAARVSEKLKLDEAKAKTFAGELDKAWLTFYAEYQKAIAAGPAQENAAELLAQMPKDVRLEAEALLSDPAFVHKLMEDFAALGIAGERELAFVVYLTGTSRLLERPLAARVHGPSTSGKSYIIGKVADLFPPETIIRATQMTPQALFHMPPRSLIRRFIVGGERARLENDVSAEATRALREMISSGKLSKLMPVKVGGEIITRLIEQDGPIAFIESTTLAQVFDEDANRAITLHTDERPEQTKRIITVLAERYGGHVSTANTERICQRHFALQRLLEPCTVVIPYAERLAEQLDHQRVELRRAFPQLMSTIQAITLLHQWQRKQDGQGHLLATAADYQLARRLLAKPMLRILGGGLSEPARRFYDRLKTWATAPFTSSDARKKETHSQSSVKSWLSELREAGLVEVIEEKRGRSPATWKVTDVTPEERARTVLPEVGTVCPEGSCPHDHKG